MVTRTKPSKCVAAAGLAMSGADFGQQGRVAVVQALDDGGQHVNVIAQARELWCCRKGLNFRPPPYQGGALPLSYGSVRDAPGEYITLHCLTRRGAIPGVPQLDLNRERSPEPRGCSDVSRVRPRPRAPY